MRMKNTSAEHLKASVGMKANNDDSKRNFGLIDDAIFIIRHGNIHRAGQAMCQEDNDYEQRVEPPVTIRQSKREIDGEEAESPVIGSVHGLNSKLQEFLLVVCKTNAAAYDQDYSVVLHCQRAVQTHRRRVLQKDNLKKLKKTSKKLIGCTNSLIHEDVAKQQHSCSTNLTDAVQLSEA